MPELRKDPIVGRWVIIATERARAPARLRSRATSRARGRLPVLPGHEDKTPPEVLAYPPAPTGRRRGPTRPAGGCASFPNKFPALMIEGDLDREGDGIYDRMNGIGAHEVIVETPDHTKRFSDLSEAEIDGVLGAYRDRIARPASATSASGTS